MSKVLNDVMRFQSATSTHDNEELRQAQIDQILHLLGEIDHHQVCLLATAFDGYVQTFQKGKFVPMEEGEELVVGRVIRTGYEDWSGIVESYIDVEENGTRLRIFISGIVEGYVFDAASLRKILHEARELEDSNPWLHKLMERTGFVSL